MENDKGMGKNRDGRAYSPRPKHPPARRLGRRAGGDSPAHYDFSDLTSADQSEAAFRYLDKNWRIVPLDNLGELVPIDETEEPAIVPSWVEDPSVRVGIATGRKSGIVALWFPKKLITRPRRKLTKHPHPPTLENEGIDGYYVIFRAPKEDLPCQQIDEGAYFLGEGGAILPEHDRWGTACVELAPLPDSLRRLVLGEPPPSIKEKIAAGDIAAANKATAYEAAQGYDALGLKLLPVLDYTTCRAIPKGANGTFVPELWEKHRTEGIGIRAGVRSGVVGLLFPNHGPLNQLRSKYGPVSSTMIDGSRPILCFRAPAEKFQSQEILEGVVYIGEDDFFPAPPSTVNGRELEWEVAGPFPQWLPEVPPWLRDRLGQRQEADAAARAPRAKSATSAAKPKPTQGREQRSHLSEFARNYAVRGLPIFPLKPNSAEPLSRKASEQATTDPETISRRWSKTSLANIGVRTGGASGVAVLVAHAGAGVRSLADLEEQHGAIQTPRAQDTSGGLLLLFDGPESGVESRAGFLPGLDFLSNGCFAVLPPSRIEGRECRWVDQAQKGKTNVPDWLLALIAEQAQNARQDATASTAAPDFVDQKFDRLDAWLEERCEIGEGFSEKASVLLADFSDWLGKEVTQQLFGRLVSERGFQKKKASIWWYLGLHLKACPA